MRHYKFIKVFLLATLSLLSTHSFSIECQSATEFAKTFFKNDRLFHAQEAKTSKGYVTPQFYASLNHNWECAVKNGAFCNEVEPWSNSNGIPLESPVSVDVVSETANEAKTKFVFSYKPNETANPQLIIDYLILKKAQSGCWKVDDFILSSGESLSKIYSSYKL